MTRLPRYTDPVFRRDTVDRWLRDTASFYKSVWDRKGLDARRLGDAFALAADRVGPDDHVRVAAHACAAVGIEIDSDAAEAADAFLGDMIREHARRQERRVA
ncbi:hypothetical protein [Roseibium sp. RKSG952]|uniref:hypothetical protein n=1 Tax=Roseibium sp. RKSG952 TaxID=2529384 RepID=UPI0012BC9905|nr:hypothetical protein [Roseibium sp. RKSG952]MTH95050.1 hypothetical protein [Roseibium sp. RKSG952]